LYEVLIIKPVLDNSLKSTRSDFVNFSQLSTFLLCDILAQNKYLIAFFLFSWHLETDEKLRFTGTSKKKKSY